MKTLRRLIGPSDEDNLAFEGGFSLMANPHHL
jgi:hypothetical protein